MGNYFETLNEYRPLMVKKQKGHKGKPDRVRIVDLLRGETTTFHYNKLYETCWEGAIVWLLGLKNPIHIKSVAPTRKGEHMLLTEDMETPIRQ